MWVLCYCLFLFCDIKSSNLSFPQTKPVKLKILDITFSSFDCFNGNKIKINFCGKEFKALHNLRKQKHLVILPVKILIFDSCLTWYTLINQGFTIKQKFDRTPKVVKRS